MHGTARRFIALAFVLVPAFAWADPLMIKSPEQEDAAHIAALIKQLGDNNFYEREAASQALEEIGEPVMEELRKVSETDADLEIRHRAAVLVDKIEVHIGLTKGPTSADDLIGHLKDSKYPSYREWAALQLVGVNDASRPSAVEALVTACHNDGASNVRLACVRSLGQMKIVTPAVLKTLRELKKDADPRVRDQAQKTYANMPHELPAPKE
jgi:HEAT repeat protein